MTRGDAMDLGDRFGRAAAAARRGDVAAVEAELTRLGGLEVERLSEVCASLLAMARSVRAHPSYKQAPAAQAG